MPYFPKFLPTVNDEDHALNLAEDRRFFSRHHAKKEMDKKFDHQAELDRRRPQVSEATISKLMRKGLIDPHHG